ncbi:DUF1236 domain-containing protein [Leisingera sp.]|uniref:DUF1236 domain-containing protein n=1 Tax=Leisingera sp. TaxID=1879318 RepID=UPI002B27A265|nr:DUF1236 domain-containing protein [Leisingera sp.]
MVTGVMIPEQLQLTEVPDSAYWYVYLNGLPVLVEADSRTVIHVIRWPGCPVCCRRPFWGRPLPFAPPRRNTIDPNRGLV